MTSAVAAGERPARGAWAGPLLLLSLLVAAFGLGRAWTVAQSGAGIDFYQFWAGARLARTVPPGSFYDADRWEAAGRELSRAAVKQGRSARQIEVARARQRLELNLPPLLYMAFGACNVFGSYDAALLAHQGVSLAVFVAALVALCRAFSWSASATALLVGFAGAFVLPLSTDLRVGSVTAFQLGLLAVLILLIRPPLSAGRACGAGALIALAVLFKPSLALLVPLALIEVMRARRRDVLRAHAVGLLSAAALAIATSSLYFRSANVWFDWFGAMATLPEAAIPLEIGNFSLSRLVLGARAPVLGAVVLLVLGAVAFRRTGPDVRAPSVDRGLVVALAPLLFFVASPLVWVHYLLLALPAVVVLLRPRVLDGPAWRPTMVRAFAALALAAVAIDPWQGLVSSVRVVALVANAGIVTLIVLCLVELLGPGGAYARQRR